MSVVPAQFGELAKKTRKIGISVLSLSYTHVLIMCLPTLKTRVASITPRILQGDLHLRSVSRFHCMLSISVSAHPLEDGLCVSFSRL